MTYSVVRVNEYSIVQGLRSVQFLSLVSYLSSNKLIVFTWSQLNILSMYQNECVLV